MNRLCLWLLVLAGLFCGTVPAATAGEIELEDGSRITGEITSLRDGIYTIETGSLGTLLVDESKVRIIRIQPQRENVPAKGNSPTAPNMDAMKMSIMNNEEVMQSIMALQNDPEIMKIIQDPAIMGAVLSGDVNSLMANPRFMELMNHPELRQIQKDLAR